MGFKSIEPGQIGHVYCLRLKSDPALFKIGRSALGKLDSRFSRLRVGDLLESIFVGIFLNYREWERIAHIENRDVRLPQSEYFRLSGERLEVLLCALEKGNLVQEVQGCQQILLSADEQYLQITNSDFEELLVAYPVADSFCNAVVKMHAKIGLTAQRCFLEANNEYAY